MKKKNNFAALVIGLCGLLFIVIDNLSSIGYYWGLVSGFVSAGFLTLCVNVILLRHTRFYLFQRMILSFIGGISIPFMTHFLVEYFDSNLLALDVYLLLAIVFGGIVFLPVAGLIKLAHFK